MVSMLERSFTNNESTTDMVCISMPAVDREVYGNLLKITLIHFATGYLMFKK
jgi:hypothetical protein